MMTFSKLARYSMKFILHKCRLLNASQRALPSFIIIGAQKCGTSSLYAYMGQHPELVPSYTKEVHFFDGGLNPSKDTYLNGVRWYRAHFPLKKKMKSRKTFEASPLYLFHPLAAERMYKLLPNVKIIVLLRNPTERAISQYYFGRDRGRDNVTIDVALSSEEERLAESLDSQSYHSHEYIYYSYKARGRYCEQLERYIALFGRESLLVINFEDFISNPQAQVAKAFEFVGVDSKFEVKDLRPRNVAKKHSKASCESHKLFLNQYYMQFNQDLYSLLGDEFSRWE